MADYSRWNPNGRSRFQSWQRIATDGSVIKEGWNRSGFLNESDTRDDHVCRPVVIGADGRARPVVPHCPPVHPEDRRTDSLEGVIAGDQYGGGVSRIGIFQRSKGANDDMSSYRVVESSRSRWGLPPSEPLGKVTNETYTAAEYVRELANPTSVAATGADQWNSASPPMYEGRRRGPTIDSREAAKRYGGQFIW